MQQRSKMTLLVLLWLPKLHLHHSELIGGAGTLFSTCWLLCVCAQLWGKAGERLSTINTGTEWWCRLKQLLRLLWPTGTAELLFGNIVHRSTPAIIPTAGYRCKTNKHTNTQVPRLQGWSWQLPTLRVPARSFSLRVFQPFSVPHSLSASPRRLAMSATLALSGTLFCLLQFIFSSPPPFIPPLTRFLDV